MPDALYPEREEGERDRVDSYKLCLTNSIFHTGVHICTHTYIYIYTHAYICIYIYIHRKTYIHTYMLVCLQISLYIHISTSIHIYIYIYLHIYIYTYDTLLPRLQQLCRWPPPKRRPSQRLVARLGSKGGVSKSCLGFRVEGLGFRV